MSDPTGTVDAAAPHVALLHGLGADKRAFARFERLLPAEWDTVSLDMLGHGDAPKPQSGYALDDHAAYVIGALREARPGARWALVGHSYGAAIAIAVTALAPDLVERVVLLDPATGMRGDAARMAQARREGNVDTHVREMFSSYGAALQQWVIETWNAMHVGVVDEHDGEWWRFLDRVQAPITLVHGDRAQGATGEDAQQYLPGVPAVRIAGAGHLVHATHARETAAAVIEAIEPSRTHEVSA